MALPKVTTVHRVGWTTTPSTHLAVTPASSTMSGGPLALLPAWLLCCYFLIVVVGGVITNVLLVATAVRWRCRRRGGSEDNDMEAPPQDADDDDGDGGLVGVDRDRGWWFLLGQLAATDALSLCLVSGGELWSVRETGGPWRLPGALCAPFMGLEAMLHAAQTYLLVALALHARATPTDPVPRLSVWRHISRSAVVPSALIWMLASSVAVPRTFLAVAVWPRPSHPLCTLLPTSPATGALEGPLDVVVGLEAGTGLGPGPSGSWWPLGTLAVDYQGGGLLLSSIVLCAVPTIALLGTASATAISAICRSRRPQRAGGTEGWAPHKLARREWVRVSTWLSVSWLLLSLPRLASAAAHGFLPPDLAPKDHGPSSGPWAFRTPPLGSRALDDASLLAASMLHYALVAARPVLATLASPTLRRAASEAYSEANDARTVHGGVQDDDDGEQAEIACEAVPCRS